MSQAARVTSIDVLPLLAAALQKFRSEGAGAVDDVASEVRRALEWIHHDIKDYWTTELRHAEDALSQARVQLQQAMAVRRIGDRSPSCADEKRVVERAKRRMETARRKLEAVRHWSIALERAADDFRRSHMQFASWIDIDISRAAATLNKMSESLVSYVSLKGSDEAEKPAEPAAATGETETPAGQEKGTE
ncbi:MAG: hypothetical protein WBL72_05015 [Thermoguttaceae bacterium]|jgi:hypothetical protein